MAAKNWSGLGLDLSSTAAGLGATFVGYEDQGASLVGATVNAALDELALPITLSAGAESGNAIPVTVTGPAQIAQYVARVYDADMLLAVVGAITVAETGPGAGVSTTAKPALLFTTDANGAAVVTVTDVSGSSTASFYVEVSPLSVSAGAKAGPSAILSITFA